MLEEDNFNENFTADVAVGIFKTSKAISTAVSLREFISFY